MFDIGWQEFTLAAFVLLIVVGPKDLPKVLKLIIKAINKVKSMAFDFQKSVNEISDEIELSELKKDVKNIKNSNSLIDTKEHINELKQMTSSTKKILNKNKKSSKTS